jgi:hypothetical protein
LGTPRNIWQAPAPVLFPGASAAPQWVTILNRSSNNQDIWVWDHTYQLDSDEAILGEDGTLYKITIDAETGEVGNAVSRDLGQEGDSPQLAQGNAFVFMGRTYSGELKTISSSTLDQLSACTLNSHPACDDPFGLSTRADGTRLFTISRKGTVSSLAVNANGAVQPLASQTMAVNGIPFEVASDADGTHLFVSSYDGYPSLVRRITAFKVLQDGALIEGANVVSNNAEQIQVLSH